MKIKRFNESFEYPKDVKDEIILQEADKERVRYIIETADNERPERTWGYASFEKAIEDLKSRNEQWYCLFEMKIRALTEEEIDLMIQSKKYNL